MLAPIAALAFATGEWFACRSFAKVRRSFIVAASIAVATLVTPHGVKLWSYAFGLAVASNPTREHLDAWRALAFDVPGALTAVLPGLLLLVVFGIQRSRRYTSEILVGALCLVLTIMHARYSMFLAAGWAPLIARSLDHQAPFVALARSHPRVSPIAVLPAILLALFIGITKLSTPVEPVGPWQSAASIVADHGLRGNAYAPYAWAAFLHWRGLPVRLLIDAHGDPYPKDVWDDSVALEKVRANWRDVLRRRNIETVVVPLDSPLAQAMLPEPSWRRIETRDGIVAFQRTRKRT